MLARVLAQHRAPNTNHADAAVQHLYQVSVLHGLRLLRKCSCR